MWEWTHPSGPSAGKDLAGVFTFWDVGISQTEHAIPRGNEASWAQHCGGRIFFVKKRQIFPLSAQTLPSVWMFPCPPHKNVPLTWWHRKQHVGVNSVSAASRSCYTGGIVCLPALVLRFLFSDIMLHKAALIFNLFQIICFLFAFSCWSYRPEQTAADNCLPGLSSSCHSALQTSAMTASLQPLKTENLGTEVSNPQHTLLLASTMSFCSNCSKRSLLEGEVPWKSRGDRSTLGNRSQLASIIMIDTVREEGEGAVSNGLGNWNKWACRWDDGCSCTLTPAGAKLGAINWLLALTVILMSFRCQLTSSNR